jgi:hypothetical protein
MTETGQTMRGNQMFGGGIHYNSHDPEQVALALGCLDNVEPQPMLRQAFSF